MNLTGKPVRAGVVFDKINRMTPANAIGFHNIPMARHCSGVCHPINEITPLQTTTGVFITPVWDIQYHKDRYVVQQKRQPYDNGKPERFF